MVELAAYQTFADAGQEIVAEMVCRTVFGRHLLGQETQVEQWYVKVAQCTDGQFAKVTPCGMLITRPDQTATFDGGEGAADADSVVI